MIFMRMIIIIMKLSNKTKKILKNKMIVLFKDHYIFKIHVG